MRKIYPNLDEEQYQPNGIDLRIGELYKFSDDFEDVGIIGNEKILPKLEKINWSEKTINGKFYDKLLVLEPQSAYRVKVKDETNIPRDKIEDYRIRSGFGRSGIILSAGIGDASYSGNLEFTLYNSLTKPFYTCEGTRFAQMIMFYLDQEPSAGYEGDYQNNKHLSIEKED